MYYIYLLKCADGTLYCGYTNNVSKRVQTHNSGKGAKYTKCRLPVELLHSEEFATKSEALRREYEVKKLSRIDKLKLISEGDKMKEIKLGKYRHFKGNYYEVLYLAKHSETLEEMVVYRALYGDGGIWVRPAKMWNETIERDGKKFVRFEKVDDEI